MNPDEEENDHGDAAEGEEGVQQQRTHERHLRKNYINSRNFKKKFIEPRLLSRLSEHSATVHLGIGTWVYIYSS